MFRLAVACLLLASGLLRAEIDVTTPPHEYWTRPTQDRFSRLKTELESGAVTLDTSGDLPLLRSLLAKLEIPISSQIIVFSNASKQTRIISPRNPRALYFNEDTSVGFVPGGQIEIASLDPALGGVFQIFDPLRGGQLPRIDRPKGCAGCHVETATRHVPGLVVQSFVPGMRGSPISVYRRDEVGHQIPIADRFGGYIVTGLDASVAHHGNLIRDIVNGEHVDRTITPGELYDPNRLLTTTSDVLPQVIMQHQAGFVNLAVEATYRSRELPAGDPVLNKLAYDLVRYLLFADEAPLPVAIAGDTTFKTDFLATRRGAKSGASLKDFDLQTRLFRYRCSYMIYSPTFEGLPADLKQRVYRGLAGVLQENGKDPRFTYLPVDERRTILAILRETIPGWPGGA